MKNHKILLKVKDMKTNQKAIEKMYEIAEKENAEVEAFVFDPDKQFMLKKETVYILVFFSALIGYLMGSAI